MKIALASDHAGWELKNHLHGVLSKTGHEVIDLGAFNSEPSDYPDYAALVGRAIQAGNAERGVLICGSGVGASVAANKLKGIRAGLCHDCYSARQGVEHDDINVLVLGSRVIGQSLAENLLQGFLSARFSGEPRHMRRLQKVQRLEEG